MPEVRDVFKLLDEWAPCSTKMSYDNVGLLAGRNDKNVSCVFVTLDITPDKVGKAFELGAELIVSHHPFIFNPLYTLTGGSSADDAAIALIKRDVSAICMHTNLDIAMDGVSDALAETLNLENIRGVEGNDVLRVGELPKVMSAGEFAAYVSEKLNTHVKFVRGGDNIITVAVCGGAGGSDDEYPAVKAYGCDAYVSGEFKHHILLDGRYSHITLIDAGHYATEYPICRKIADRISNAYPGIKVVTDSFDEIVEFI